MKTNRFLRTMRRRLPSPAMVVACIALAVALGGTSYAAIRLPANSVGTPQLKPGAVTAVKVRGNSLTGTQINERRLAEVPSAQFADRAQVADLATNAETADSAVAATRAPVARLEYQSTAVALPADIVTLGTANCPSGLNAISGGVHLPDPFHGNIADTFPFGKTAWAVHAYSTVAQTMTVWVVCAPAASTN